MRADVTEAQRTVARLSDLATAMLELSRIDAQRVSGRATVARLSVELAEAADRGRMRVGARAITVDYVDETASPGTVVNVGDADFGRVIDNLVSNALAAVPEDGRVDIRMRLGEDLCIEVDDNGPGMDPEYIAFAFDRFSRESASRARGGAGLGLSIVAGIVATARGSIELHNRQGAGLRVEVHIPLEDP